MYGYGLLRRCVAPLAAAGLACASVDETGRPVGSAGGGPESTTGAAPVSAGTTAATDATAATSGTQSGNPGTRPGPEPGATDPGTESDSGPTATTGTTSGAPVTGETGSTTGPGVEPSSDPAAPLYAPTALPTFELDIPPASWQALRDAPDVYAPATFRHGTTVLQQVGVRLKGVASFRSIDDTKPAFKVKFNHVLPGQTFLGLKRMTLNNMVQDPSKVAERLAYGFFQRAGVDAPRCNSARLLVNGTYYGVYANLESIDGVFLAKRYEPSPGNLYDIAERWNDLSPGREDNYELETNETLADTRDLTALIAAVFGTGSSFTTRVEPILDLEAVLKVGAVQAVIADWDGYFGSSNNYKLYHELARDRFILFPWGLDQTFLGLEQSFKPDYDIDHHDAPASRGVMFERCMCEPTCASLYRAKVAEVLTVFEATDLEGELAMYAAQIRPALAQEFAERGRGSVDEVEEAQAERLAFLRARADFVRQGLVRPVEPGRWSCP